MELRQFEARYVSHSGHATCIHSRPETALTAADRLELAAVVKARKGVYSAALADEAGGLRLTITFEHATTAAGKRALIDEFEPECRYGGTFKVTIDRGTVNGTSDIHRSTRVLIFVDMKNLADELDVPALQRTEGAERLDVANNDSGSYIGFSLTNATQDGELILAVVRRVAEAARVHLTQGDKHTLVSDFGAKFDPNLDSDFDKARRAQAEETAATTN